MRRYKRITTNIPIEIKIKNSRQRGVLLNISEGGALIGYPDPIKKEFRAVKKFEIASEIPVIGTITYFNFV